MKIQDIYLSLGNYGCLLLCYLHEANIKVDIAKYFDELVELDIIENVLIIIATILLSIPLYFIYFAGITCFIWLPMLLGHWSSIIISLVITVGTEIIRDKFFCD